MKEAISTALESIEYSRRHIRNHNYDFDAETDAKLRKQAMDKLDHAAEWLREVRNER